MDAGCASSIEAIESGEAHAPELAHVAGDARIHARRLDPQLSPSLPRTQYGFKECGTISAFAGHNVGKRDSTVRAALGLFERPIATAATALRVVGLLGWAFDTAGEPIAEGKRRQTCSWLPRNQGAMAVLAGLKGVCLAFVTRST